MSLSTLEWHITGIGILFIILALSHAFFPAYFKWRQDLAPISLINRQIMHVHMFFIALVVFLLGILCLTSAHELLHTRLGQKLSLGLGIFWGIRLFFQFFVYSPKLWRGKRFETTIHILFSLLWLYISAIFILAFLH